MGSRPLQRGNKPPILRVEAPGSGREYGKPIKSKKMKITMKITITITKRSKSTIRSKRKTF
jgi:hypothetical protein